MTSKQRAVIDAVDHLIRPWVFTEHQRQQRDHLLLKLNWQINTQRLEEANFQFRPRVPEALTIMAENPK